MWNMLPELWRRFHQMHKKKKFIYTDYCVRDFTKPMHAFLLPYPLPHSHALLLDHQQGLA